ncbi:Glucan endo-1,3-beta-glucosidase-like protein 3 [Morella rubra]|uniref:Glucan endo-1,3-beta-glucosidase-like protein 3 n=1 Tax=Morella rubra TaxID=262757 RepID=A0A6A1VV91_9ROSI|nr:Glucan endo-1,3-beta-glucosidase-like protein 3 [Morella rubra]
MAVLAFLVLVLAMTGHSSATWCVCKDGVGDSNLQKSLDYACGAGADCNPIHQTGPCYQPNNVKAHCSYAVNSYFQKKGQAQGSCDFSGTAAISTTDPSSTGCVYPSSASAAGTTTTPVTTTPSTTTPTSSNTTPTTVTPATTSPYTTTPSNGVLGGIGTGVGPSGAGINTDESHGGLRLIDTTFFSFFTSLLFTGLMLWWG